MASQFPLSDRVAAAIEGLKAVSTAMQDRDLDADVLRLGVVIVEDAAALIAELHPTPTSPEKQP